MYERSIVSIVFICLGVLIFAYTNQCSEVESHTGYYNLTSTGNNNTDITEIVYIGPADEYIIDGTHHLIINDDDSYYFLKLTNEIEPFVWKTNKEFIVAKKIDGKNHEKKNDKIVLLQPNNPSVNTTAVNILCKKFGLDFHSYKEICGDTNLAPLARLEKQFMLDVLNILEGIHEDPHHEHKNNNVEFSNRIFKIEIIMLWAMALEILGIAFLAYYIFKIARQLHDRSEEARYLIGNINNQ